LERFGYKLDIIVDELERVDDALERSKDKLNKFGMNKK